MKVHLWMLLILFSVGGCASSQNRQIQVLEQNVAQLQARQEEMQADFAQRLSSMEMSQLRQERFLQEYFDVPGPVVDSDVPRGPEPGLKDDPALLEPVPALQAAKPAPKPKVKQPPKPKAQAKPRSGVDSGQAFYDQALKKYQAGEYVPAREDFTAFAERYPKSPLQANALYWLAETHYAQKQFAQSILVFKELSRLFPKSHKTPDALLKVGYAYEQLGDIPNARFHLQIVLDDHPRAPAAKLAREKLGAMPAL